MAHVTIVKNMKNVKDMKKSMDNVGNVEIMENQITVESRKQET